MNPATFTKFTEYNDYEGEGWVFWLEVDGNEEELAKLLDLMVNTDEYWLEPIFLNEDHVDSLVKHCGSGYTNYHNKVTGRFTCPSQESFEHGAIYKGGITDFFEVV